MVHAEADVVPHCVFHTGVMSPTQQRGCRIDALFLLRWAHDPTMKYTLRASIGYSSKHYKSFHLVKDNMTWVVGGIPGMCVIRNWGAVQVLCLAGLTRPGDLIGLT